MNILLTSVGRRSYLVEYFKSAVASLNGKVHAANSIETYALQQADEHVITPEIYSEAYIPFLLDYCQSNQITIIISLFDIDLPILAKNKVLFKQSGIEVIVSDKSVIDICNDKWRTYQFLVGHNINTPQTYISLNDAIAALNNNTLTYPVIIKPRWGMGSIGIYKADNIEELHVLYNKVKNEINSSYLRFESAADSNAILIQECIQSDEYGIEVINDLEKNYITTFCKQKLAMRSGETDQAITIENRKLSAIGKALSSSLGHIGILDSDCLEKNGEYFVLELNARFGGQYPFSHLAGANIPKQIVDWCIGQKTNKDLTTITVNILCSKDIKPVKL
ncbi:ATP-grasp domain-containing protein [Pseudoalteromonas sp. MMG010]|uniref:ATP-grasp domain-containing protein n=1 Tax=Pseudoalteromonas sp. MMG010 TaxID=2822685 RepID=UPI001B3A6A9E|nr:ATP-grasp domain-containing protein [Pseudoalteromonas sp. MMG010]MBQ4834226.1 ATP-grasp domain-containing protein [Pseudoalteromonas sp. MMG010]